MSNLSNKRWEELVLGLFKERGRQLKELDAMLDGIKDLISGDYKLSDMEDYVAHIDANVHIPTWNRFPETTPDMMKVNTIENKYWVFIKPDFIFEAVWRESAFYTFMERDDGDCWGIEKAVSFWIPITYPTPY